MSGIQMTPIRWPDRWDPAFMDRLIREVFAKADVRNANAGTGITITGTPDEVATISASQDIEDLLAGGPLTALDSGVDTARQVVAGDGSIIITDNGGGSTLEIAVGTIQLTQLGALPDLSVIGVPTADDGFDLPTSINALANDTVLRRVNDELDFGELTPGMFPDSTVAAWDSTSIEIATALFDLAGNIELTGDLTIYDAGGTDSIVLSHTGASALFLFTGTGDAVFSGITGAYHFVSSSGEVMRLRGSGTGAAAMSYLTFEASDGTDLGFVGDGSSADIVQLVAYTGDAQLRSVAANVTLQPTGAGYVGVIGGGAFRLYDGSGTDYGTFSHNGTNLVMSGVNTSNFVVANLVLAVSHSTVAGVASFDSSATGGPYTTFLDNGTPMFDIGMGAQMGGGFNANAAAISARGAADSVDIGYGTSAQFRITSGGVVQILSSTFDINSTEVDASATARSGFGIAARSGVPFRIGDGTDAVEFGILSANYGYIQVYDGANYGNLSFFTLNEVTFRDSSNNVRFTVKSDGSGASLIGDFTATGDGTFNTSDRRYKRDIVRIDRALERIRKIRGYTFRKKVDGRWERKRRAAVIAQEIEGALPEAVIRNNDGYRLVSDASLSALFAEALNEVVDRIEALEAAA